MWRLAFLALASSIPAGQPKLAFGGEAFGPQRALTCTWFTNFENSRFDHCKDAAGKMLADGESASIKCKPALCEELDAAARQAIGWTKPAPPWGTFKVELLGRISLKPHHPRYLGDGTRTVLIEKLTSVRPAE